MFYKYRLLRFVILALLMKQEETFDDLFACTMGMIIDEENPMQILRNILFKLNCDDLIDYVKFPPDEHSSLEQTVYFTTDKGLKVLEKVEKIL